MDALKLFVLLADETRLEIIKILQGGEKCVCEIIPGVNRTQSTVSIQLGKMVDFGILKSRREGRKVFYRIVDYRVCEIFKILKFNEKNVCHKNCCNC